MPEVVVLGKKCEFECSDSVARAFLRLAEKYFADPKVQSDYEKWLKEQDDKEDKAK